MNFEPAPEAFDCGPYTEQFPYEEGDRVCQPNADGTFQVYECTEVQECRYVSPEKAASSGWDYWRLLNKTPPADAATALPIPFFPFIAV